MMIPYLRKCKSFGIDLGMSIQQVRGWFIWMHGLSCSKEVPSLRINCKQAEKKLKEKKRKNMQMSKKKKKEKKRSYKVKEGTKERKGSGSWKNEVVKGRMC